jgi:hypothetical protein
MDEKWMLELLDGTLKNQQQQQKNFEQLLVEAISHKIETDFAGLCQLLYRIDVDEYKLKTALQSSDEPPAEIIARLLLERQKQKLALRASFKMDVPKDTSEEELW